MKGKVTFLSQVDWRKPAGSFSCGDARKVKMWQIGVETLRCCTRTFLVDGIKRDRLPWAADLAVEILAEAYSFGDPEPIKRTLAALGSGDPKKVESVWGKMTDFGVNTFWEGWDASETESERYVFYSRPFAKSLCHAWASGPVFIIPASSSASSPKVMTGGFAPSGSFEAGPLKVDVGVGAATVWASSLDGSPLQTSKRILITHLTDVQADGNVYADPARTILLKWGSGIVVRNGRARVEIVRADAAACEVWGLETSGRRLERLPTEVRDGRLAFTASVEAKDGARLLYEVVSK